MDQEYMKARTFQTLRGMDLNLPEGTAMFERYGPVFIELIQEEGVSGETARYSAYLWVRLTNGHTHCERLVTMDYRPECMNKIVDRAQLALRALFIHGLTTK